MYSYLLNLSSPQSNVKYVQPLCQDISLTNDNRLSRANTSSFRTSYGYTCILAGYYLILQISKLQ
jgi:hypothetical protein